MEAQGKTSIPTRRTQLERRAEAESRLLNAARAIVARKGWNGITLAEVGEVAGYSRGLATHRFGNKAGLLRALTSYVNSSFMSDIKAAPQRRAGLDALKGIVQVYFSGAADSWTNNRALLVLMTEAVTQDSELQTVLAEYNRTVLDYFARYIEIGIANAEISADICPSASAALILGAIRGVMLQYLLKPSDFDLGRIQDQLFRFIDSAFAVPETSR